MPRSALVGLLYGAWDDLDRVLEGVTPEEALTRHDGASAFAWTLGHVTGNLDFLVNERVRGGSMHPTLRRQFEAFGTTGDASDWPGVLAAVRDVRASLRPFLEPLTDADLERFRFPATGDWPEISLRYILYRVIAHHYYYIGEIATIRNRHGHPAGDCPGALAEAS